MPQQTGSLKPVTCRTGSLENLLPDLLPVVSVTCRTGSLIPIFSLKPCSTVIPAQAGMMKRCGCVPMCFKSVDIPFVSSVEAV